MKKSELLLDIKGLVINNKIDAAIDLILIGFNDYEDINDFWVLQSQYNATDILQDKNRIIRTIIDKINQIRTLPDNNVSIPMDVELKIQSVLKSPYALITDKKNVSFYVTHHHASMPYSFDYFIKDGIVEKAYTETDFGLLLTINNPLDEEVLISNIAVRTVYFEQIRGRILRQHGPKGFIEPVEFNFRPSMVIGDSVDILKAGTLYGVNRNSTERILLKLGKPQNEGFYKIIVSIKVIYKNYTPVLESAIIPLSIQSSDSRNKITLNIAVSHHDKIAQYILKLDNEKWDLIKSESENDDNMVFIGQTMTDASYRRIDTTWKIKKLIKKSKDKHGFSIDANQESLVVLDLKIPYP